MVSEEEYDYAAFRCAFCKTLNPAKKLRPIGPRISSHMPNISHYQSPIQQLPLRSSAAGSDSSASKFSSRQHKPSSSSGLFRDSNNPILPFPIFAGSDSDDARTGVAPSTEQPLKKPPETPIEPQSNGSAEDIVQSAEKSAEAVDEQQINEVPIEELSDKPVQLKKDE